MSAIFRLEIVTPSGGMSVRTVSFLDVPGAEGRLSVLAHHEPMICSLDGGVVRIREDDEAAEERLEVGPGTLEVTRNVVTLLVREIRPEPRGSKSGSR